MIEGVNVNNKGFTLVELLAVLVILLAISLVAVGGISASLERRNIKECEEQKELAIGAAKIYFSLNDINNVSILILKSEKYFSDDSKVDRLNDNDTISFDVTSNKYEYVGTNCE